MSLQEIDPRDVARWMAERSIVLIDVREPTEYAAERIAGALLFPLSTFDPLALPDCGDRKIVFHCGSGMRSAKAVSACAASGKSIDTHMRGGIQAWKAAGLPTIVTDPATGQIRQTR
jgi:rhodanese-related sulfurtransferase